MKKFFVTLIVLLVLGWLFLAFVGVEPKDRRPGTLLAGELAQLPADLDFLNAGEASEVHIETRPWYGIPFSVTTVIGHGDGLIVVPSLYGEVMAFPGNKYWNGVVDADPLVRLRVDGKLYEFAIYPISDSQEFDRGLAVLAAKYPFWKKTAAESQPPYPFALLKLVPPA